MTVECIATEMGRPLLCLTVADIGTKETEAELNLSKWLAHATKWGAIVLIDEAETFLTKRREGDMSRNAIVAAFLRTLEYHQGMIFLTTNEPGRIDDAIMSRIHLAIQYRTLTKDQRSQIWTNMIEQLERDEDRQPPHVPKIKITSTAIALVTQESGFAEGEIDQLKVSGRDIRNAFQAAVRLARHEHSKEAKPSSSSSCSSASGKPAEVIQLKPAHFSRAFRSKLELKKSKDGIRGRNIEQRATDEGLRRENQIPV